MSTLSTEKNYKAYKVEIDPNNRQITSFNNNINAARFVYNHFLRERIDLYEETGKSTNFVEQCRQLTLLKKEKEWLKRTPYYSLQLSLKNLDNAFKAFYRRLKRNEKEKGFPLFKKKRTSKKTFTIRRDIKIIDNHIILPKMSPVRIKEHDYIPSSGKILSATISNRAGKWFASVIFETTKPAVKKATGPRIGVDFGIKTLAVVSDGREFANIHALKNGEKRLNHLHKQLSRKYKKGQPPSKNYEKNRELLAKQYYKVSCQKYDWMHKVSTEITARTKPENERPSVIVLENLNVAGMMKNKKLAKAISEVGFGEFRRQIEYKAELSGIEIVIADRFYPSSKLCSECGYKNSDLKLKDREWTCPKCGVIHDRDHNAAVNLKNYASTASPAGIHTYGDMVRPKALVAGGTVDEVGINHQRGLT